jgi:hypothetical protein
MKTTKPGPDIRADLRRRGQRIILAAEHPNDGDGPRGGVAAPAGGSGLAVLRTESPIAPTAGKPSDGRGGADRPEAAVAPAAAAAPMARAADSRDGGAARTTSRQKLSTSRQVAGPAVGGPGTREEYRPRRRPQGRRSSTSALSRRGSMSGRANRGDGRSCDFGLILAGKSESRHLSDSPTSYTQLRSVSTNARWG